MLYLINTAIKCKLFEIIVRELTKWSCNCSLFFIFFLCQCAKQGAELWQRSSIYIRCTWCRDLTKIKQVSPLWTLIYIFKRGGPQVVTSTGSGKSWNCLELRAATATKKKREFWKRWVKNWLGKVVHINRNIKRKKTGNERK